LGNQLNRREQVLFLNIKTMNAKPVFSFDRPVMIAGPCSAETEDQVLESARALKEQGVTMYRAGIWKPRTRPNAFEGVGRVGLVWLNAVQKTLGMPVCIEVANAEHVEKALHHGIDVFWLGARTTANPFSVQEIADALNGVDIPVLIKNPVNPDLKLWVGAFERLHKAGINQMAAVHRGFSSYADSKYRNVPRWQMAIDLMEILPGVEMICDISHICGRRDILLETAQKAFDLNYDGLMVEVHPNPDHAWSDAAQQITPSQFGDIVSKLRLRETSSADPEYLSRIENCRVAIDEIDEEIVALIARRMSLVRDIGQIKKEKNISVLQSDRFRTIRETLRGRCGKNQLSEAFVEQLLEAIHQESIYQQERVMWQAEATATPTTQKV
jgi:chorismate mutase